MLIIFPPIGLIMMWVQGKFHMAVRVVLTLIFVPPIIISLVVGGAVNSKLAPKTAAQLKAAAEQQTKVEAQEKEEEEKVLTLAKYSKISNGMTYKQVIKIIGFEVSPEVESGTKGSPFYTVSYRYMGDAVKGSLGANASFMFQGGKLNTKAQIGLED